MDRSVFHDLGLLGVGCFGGCALVALGGWLIGLPFGSADGSPAGIYLDLAGPASAVWLGLAIVAVGSELAR
ncbi:hypothetical protein [Halorubrum tibetense]|uniref:Uncharacterized protein n=1 Tax=Halorubrum tibetense TaxID=175631 RepID=A0ABD5S843_9EURY